MGEAPRFADAPEARLNAPPTLPSDEDVLALARRFVLACFVPLGGCVWTSDGGVGARYESDWTATVSSPVGTYAGEPIVIDGEGPVTIVGVEGLREITVRARYYAGARSVADAEASYLDTREATTVALRDGSWVVTCGQASQSHGTVVPSATGCAEMWIEVPAGSADAPLSLRAQTSFGGIHASGLVVDDLDLRAPFGLVADVVPVDDADLSLYGEDLVSGMCSSWLRVPEDTAFEHVALEVGAADLYYVGNDPDDEALWLQVQIEGFADRPELAPFTGSYEWERVASGAQVASATIRADLGKAIVTSGEVPDADVFSLCAWSELGNGTQTPEA